MSKQNNIFSKHPVIRNLVILIVIAFIPVFLSRSTGLTSFYDEAAFDSCAKIYHDCSDTEHRGNKWRNHTVGIEHLSSAYTFKGAILDLTPYEDEEYVCVGGVTNIELKNLSDADLIEHILVINPAHHLINIEGFAGKKLYVYTDSEYAISSNSELLPAEDFYKAQASFDSKYGSFADIVKDDYEYILYNLFKRNNIIFIAIAIISGIYLLYNNKKNLDGIIFNYNTTGEKLSGFYLICGIVMVTGIAAMTVFAEDMQSSESLMDILGIATFALTAFAALVIVILNIYMYLTEKRLFLAISRLIWSFLVPVGAGVLSFGIGLMIYEFAEAYKIIKLALFLGLLGAVIYMILMLIAIILSPFESLFKVVNGLGAALASGSNASKDNDVSGLDGGNFDIPAVIYDKNNMAYNQIAEYSDRAVYRGPNGERATIYFKHANSAGFAKTENNTFHW